MNLKLYRLIDRLPWRIAAPIVRAFPPHYGHYFIVSDQPLIVVIPEDTYDEPERWKPLFDDLKNIKTYFLRQARSAIEKNPDEYISNARVHIAEHNQVYPLHRFIYMSNNAAQSKIFEQLAVQYIDVNQNCFADERMFSILESVPKQYDAIYNAVVAPYKRHHLAASIDSLALITYLSPGQEAYLTEVTKLLSTANWLNFEGAEKSPRTYRSIPHTEVSGLINSARVGLCLSAIEGAMFASIEYLLCGLPIVSTTSIGGRDIFFSSDFSEIVEDDPSDVSRAVKELISRKIPAWEIRTATLSKIEEHRNRFVDLVMKIYDEERMNISRKDAYDRIFPNQIYRMRPLHKIYLSMHKSK